MPDWQVPYYWGKHDKRAPADDGIPYCYDQQRNGNAYWPYPKASGWVSRAIVADGMVNSRPSWECSPQVRFWLDEPKQTIWARFVEWFHK